MDQYMPHHARPPSTHYEVLDVTPTAHLIDIKRHYQKLVLEYHPDKAPKDASPTLLSHLTAHFRRIVSAWEVLQDAESRAVYDQELLTSSSLGEGPRRAGAGIVHAEVDLDAMEYEEHGEGEGEGEGGGSGARFVTACRCGGRYAVTEMELEEGVDVVG
ncbi:DnaJ sub C member 24, partial [Thoreauomyces humboldtii]